MTPLYKKMPFVVLACSLIALAISLTLAALEPNPIQLSTLKVSGSIGSAVVMLGIVVAIAAKDWKAASCFVIAFVALVISVIIL